MYKYTYLPFINCFHNNKFMYFLVHTSVKVSFIEKLNEYFRVLSLKISIKKIE